MAGNAQTNCVVVIATTKALIGQFCESLNVSTEPSATVATEHEQSSPLLLFQVAAESLRAASTKLSLLSITVPFTESAIVSLVKPLNDSVLPSLATAALLVTSSAYPDAFVSETRRLAQDLLNELEVLLDLVLRRAKDGKPKDELADREKQQFTETTGRVWERCDIASQHCTSGVAGFVVRKAEQWLALMKDAVQELQEWDPEEDVDDIFGDTDSDDDELSKFTDKSNDKTQATIAAGVKEQVLKVLSRIPQSIHVVVKQRLAKMPLGPADGSQRISLVQRDTLNSILRNVRHISESIDESAEALYRGNPELCLKKAGEARAVTINVVNAVLAPWEPRSPSVTANKEDTFIQRALLWIQQVDTPPDVSPVRPDSRKG